MSNKHSHTRSRANTFVCANCRRTVEKSSYGTANRNHCPYFLHSLHVDEQTGDRRSDCRGVMKPIAIWVRPDGEWSLIHRCERCGFIRTNRIAGDDSEAALLSMAALPMAKLPFPMESILTTIGIIGKKY